MRTHRLGTEVIDLFKAVGVAKVYDVVRKWLQVKAALLPPSPQSLIFIKPNLNNDLSALTGNSTDLRLLAAVIEVLQQRGYTHIIVGDGPNIGTYRKEIDVFKRLGVTALAKCYGVRLTNLNNEPARGIELATGPVRVAEVCLEADFFINLPKLKTHAEAGMSLAVKNLMGCVVGADKRKMHADLAANLVRLNEVIKPDLHIADALIAMEGNGPGDGWPRRTDTLMAATDAFRLDLIAARLFGLDRRQIPYLAIAFEWGHLTAEDSAVADTLQPIMALESALPRNLLARTLDQPAFNHLKDLTRSIHGQEWARRLLYRIGVMQDVYQSAEARIEALHLDWERCDLCGRCLDYCPMLLPITTSDFDFDSGRCLRCLYCVCVCPRKAITVKGELGYLRRHLDRYGQAMRQL